jgi:hypothetical protein
VVSPIQVWSVHDRRQVDWVLCAGLAQAAVGEERGDLVSSPEAASLSDRGWSGGHGARGVHERGRGRRQLHRVSQGLEEEVTKF